jgi:isoleucyl-tRNA synthetase
MPVDLKDTLNLPKTDFPMRANLPQREPLRVAHWNQSALYQRIQTRRAGGPSFVLHDGPPFTNGDVHIGTALNKCLKDITLRYKSMCGFRTPYIPGWDCHGLPIEQKVTKELQAANKQVSTAELRSLCDAFSEGWISRQREQFMRMGVLADWQHEYRTKAPGFEAEIIRTFASFVEQGLVYRSKKPVYWSIPFETALAEAEIEYRDHTSPAIWVRFRLPNEELAKTALPASEKSTYALIWTTTPWTLPANLAIAVHPETNYVLLELESERIIVAEPLAAAVCEAGGIPAVPPPVATVNGRRLEHLKARHPFIDRDSFLVLADYVTTDSGTGLVHTAPGHGAEDYITGLKYHFEPYCPVGDDGKFIDDGQVPSDLVGLSTLETEEDLAKKRTSPANIAVLKKLQEHGALFASKRYEHQYPHCWRSKTPIIFRAVDQWFVSLDAKGHRRQALDAISKVHWIPANGENRIRGAVESRPDWCISRQRSWGVPIIAFYGPDKRAWIDAGVIRAVADKIAASSEGCNLWYERSAAEILEGIHLPAGWPAATELTCGRDTLDVWLDSGSSHLATLRNTVVPDVHWPADLYLEGSDQHRGWFQSSLWTGVIVAGGAPYRSVLTHGFIVGQDGKKISKSGTYEKPPTATNFADTYGADVIRLWIASQDFREDITLSDTILKGVSDTYRQLRNTLRYQISNLHDFDPARDAVPLEELDGIDRWALHQTAVLVREGAAAYDAYEFHRVYQLVNTFCTSTLSAVYHDILKDRLYTHAANAPLRRSSQTALHLCFHALVRVLAPILVFTADEAWAFATGRPELSEESVHLLDWPVEAAAWESAEIDAQFRQVLNARAKVNEALEPLRKAGTIGKSLDAAITLKVPAGSPEATALAAHLESLAEIFIVSHVTIEESAAAELSVEACAAESLGFVRCPRCWRWVPALQATNHGEVCPRCATALG